MTERPSPPLRRRVQSRAVKVINVPMRAVLGLPVATPLGRSLMLAYITGRTTGKLYRQPLSYVRDGGALLTPGGGRWKLSLKPGVPVRLRLRGSDLTVTPELISDAGEIGRLLTVMAAGNPRSTTFIGIPRGPDAQFDRAGIERATQYGFGVVRWHPA